jgi:hypothetical protein
MILERTQNEILVRLPANVDLTELQNMIDYLEYKENSTNSKASLKDAEELAESAKNSIWTKFKSDRHLK